MSESTLADFVSKMNDEAWDRLLKTAGVKPMSSVCDTKWLEPDYTTPVGVDFYQLDEKAKQPEKAHEDDAGFDLFALSEYNVPSYTLAEIKTGYAIQVEKGWRAQIAEKSGLGAKGISIRGGVIDNCYTGELIVLYHNFSPFTSYIKAGQKVAQLIIVPDPKVTARFHKGVPPTQTERGSNGFGSTGE